MYANATSTPISYYSTGDNYIPITRLDIRLDAGGFKNRAYADIEVFSANSDIIQFKWTSGNVAQSTAYFQQTIGNFFHEASGTVMTGFRMFDINSAASKFAAGTIIELIGITYV